MESTANNWSSTASEAKGSVMMKVNDQESRGSIFGKDDRVESSIMTKGPGGFAGFDSEVQGFVTKKDREESSIM